MLDPVATAPGADALVSDSHAEATAIVAVVVIVNGKNQTSIHRHSRGGAGADLARMGRHRASDHRHAARFHGAGGLWRNAGQ